MTSILPGQTTVPKAPSGMVAAADDDSLLLADLCDEFTQRTRAGEAPNVAEYAARYPRLAAQITAVFPALLMFGEFDDSLIARSPHSTGPDPVNVAGYQIVRRLGSGGMGVVYEASHPTVSRRMAIKVLNARGQESRQIQDRFLREAEAASRLNHPNIVPFLDCGKDGQTAYLSMLYINGISLDHVLEDYWQAGRMQSGDCHESPRAVPWIARDFQRIAKLGADVASALAHAHELGTIHRDIKPANLILDRTGRIWVTDFGLAKLCHEDSGLSRTGDMIGTPRYMAPEQIRGLADERSDIYALGVTLYELASGQRAWGVTRQADLQVMRSAFELPEITEANRDVPEGLANIIMKACAHDPAERHSSATELQYVLNRFAHGKTVSDRRFRPGGRQQKIFFRLPYLLSGFLGVFVAGMLFQNAPDGTDGVATTSDRQVTGVIPGRVHHFEIVEGQRTSRTIVPTMERHIGLVMWWVSGGEDAELFEVDRSCGRLQPRHPLSFAEPEDADKDNCYRLTVGMRSVGATEQAEVVVTMKPSRAAD